MNKFSVMGLVLLGIYLLSKRLISGFNIIKIIILIVSIVLLLYGLFKKNQWFYTAII